MIQTELKIYEQLQQFTLFQGLSRTELLQMAGNTKFGFVKMSAGKTLVREGEQCTQLQFLINGQLAANSVSDDGSYRIEEQLQAPWMLQPEALFGASTRYVITIRTLSEAHFITLSKDEVLRLLDDFLIIRLNLLNVLATQSQRRGHQPWRSCPMTLEARIVRFLIDHAVYPAGAKTVYILMERLAQELNDSRLNVSRALNAMQASGLLQLHRGRIEVPSLERLLM
ncbi:MAG: Crp/Fnr family transcriptional regulator [Prevotella sp.]|nr:Crp/Fnr family transcriptional regulator [Prevotella sp.]